MRRTIALAVCALALACQTRSNHTEEELLKVERDFTTAVLSNNADAIGKFLTDDWAIIDADGRVIDKARFLSAIKTGTLVHEEMELDDLMVRAHGDSAVVTTITSTKGRFAGQEFAAQERATDFYVKRDGRWRCAFSQLTNFHRK
ncbi:MAG TPA: nuclear transport factor 2 family protein [Chthoniobacterales bacterium]|nr:nuclear transport factor 2 family protein [Chthoniobacterales bacterium]